MSRRTDFNLGSTEKKMNPNENMHDSEGNAFEPGLLITANTSSVHKYGRLWRRYYLALVFISPRKPTSSQYDPLTQTSSPPSRNTFSGSQSQHIGQFPSGDEVDHQHLLESIGEIVRERDFYRLRKFGGIERVISVLGSNLEAGISSSPNPQAFSISQPCCSKGIFCFSLEARNSCTIFLLLISAAFSFSIEIMERGYQDGWHDGAAILFAVLLLVVVPAVANYLRAKKMEKKTRLDVKVVRNRLPELIAVPDVMAGDVVVLNTGDLVPADGLYVNGEGLVLDDQLVPKIDCGRNPFLFYGSRVMEGHGHMIVTSVGADTALGKVMGSVTRGSTDRTLLEARIGKTKEYMDNVALSVSVLIAIVLLLKLICRNHKDKDDDVVAELKGNVSIGSLMKMFGRARSLTTVLTVVVVGIQHGLPVVITIVLFCWKKKVVSNQAEVMNLSALGNMGLVTVICIDATGGLICGQTEVNRFLIGENDVINDVKAEPNQVVLEALRRGISMSASLPEIYVNAAANTSLVSFLKSRWEVDTENVDQKFAIVDCRKVGYNKRGIGFVMMENAAEGEIRHLHWEGSASTILDMCTPYYDCRGKIHSMEPRKDMFEKVINELEENNLRPFAMACKQVEDQEIRQEGLNLLAIVGLKCSCRLEVTLATESLTDAGLRVILVSEEELCLVRATAYQLGIFCHRTNGTLIEGDEFRDQIRQMDIANKIEVIGSCLPEDKLLLVNQLKENGHVVAFVGGLTGTDVAALREADVGITKKSQSTGNCRECSDIVISEFYSLTRIVKLGGCVYHNIQKFIQLQLTASISGLSLNFIAAIFLDDSPLTAIQLIWVGIGTCLLGFPMMMMELESRERMTRQPVNRTQLLITQAIWKNLLFQVLYQNFLLSAFLFKGQDLPETNQDTKQSMVFAGFTLCQIFNHLNVMNLIKKQNYKALLGNLWFWFSVAAVLIMQVILVEYAESLAGLRKLNIVQWALCFLFAALPLGVGLASCTAPVYQAQTNGSYSGILTSTKPLASYLTFSFCTIIFLSFSQHFTSHPPSLQ